MKPKWSQDGPKSNTKTMMQKEALEDRLGAVLGRSWVVLGAVLEGKNLLKPFVLNGFVQINVFEKIRQAAGKRHVRP